MKAFDYNAVTYDGAVYCTECVPEGVKDEEVDPIFADSEWEYEPTCDECGEIHDYMSIVPYNGN